MNNVLQALMRASSRAERTSRLASSGTSATVSSPGLPSRGRHFGASMASRREASSTSSAPTVSSTLCSRHRDLVSFDNTIFGRKLRNGGAVCISEREPLSISLQDECFGSWNGDTVGWNIVKPFFRDWNHATFSTKSRRLWRFACSWQALGGFRSSSGPEKNRRAVLESSTYDVIFSKAAFYYYVGFVLESEEGIFLDKVTEIRGSWWCILTWAPSLPCRGLSAPQLTSKKVVYSLLWVPPRIFMHIKLNQQPGSKPGGATAELTHQILRKVPEPTCLPAQAELHACRPTLWHIRSSPEFL